MDATFSVPGRRPRSWPAPTITGHERGAASHVQGSDSLGCIELVTGDGEQVDAQIVNIHRDLADRLGGVGVDERAALLGHGRQFPDRLDRSGLVVGVHDGDEKR